MKKINTRKQNISDTKPEMSQLYFGNNYPDYKNPEETPLQIDEDHVQKLIRSYVDRILEFCQPDGEDEEHRGDLYVGSAGIAYMFWRLSRSAKTQKLYPALKHAQTFIDSAQLNAERYKKNNAERYSFLCGNAGIYAVAAAIAHDRKRNKQLSDALAQFRDGIEPSKAFLHTKYGCDEVLVGRAGYLSGCYWLNDVVGGAQPITDDEIISICQVVVDSGREYAMQHKAPLPLMYQYHGTEYLGAAHGLCAILHMLLDSPWFQGNQISAPESVLQDIKRSIDFFMTLQDAEGNFPVSLIDQQRARENYKVQWCHGAPGAVYLLAKAYLIFKEDRYLEAARRAAELVWAKGLLRKGPGICHGVGGNGYVFLLLYRLTHEPLYLYRASIYMEVLTDPQFKQQARTPDRPHSLYEGVAGTVCFLIDLLEPEQAQFPFMDVFHRS